MIYTITRVLDTRDHSRTIAPVVQTAAFEAIVHWECVMQSPEVEEEEARVSAQILRERRGSRLTVGYILLRLALLCAILGLWLFYRFFHY